MIEGLLPADGFINGEQFPTAADLACINIAKGYMPFGAVAKQSGYDVLAKFPKFAAHVARTSAADGVKEYLAANKSLEAPGLGF